ncbi:hypothetical protein GCM10007973_16570 [Polymorphobacter multimanifer]|uniref:Putative oxidoreductase n=1 Tax=Polymorphobacter multimanifer TaxID=1070431 RepID=A0A841LEJ4_9SPHN|nr:hypothetical protein [Polymorphobacter multimanifer]MBB6229463.1 putative oxidoreductase [Polymorphobacter multimanifer]GGI80768.1 hypothetical protein GCM10007973_16570 [Polymorphobacter multimanifer]
MVRAAATILLGFGLAGAVAAAEPFDTAPVADAALGAIVGKADTSQAVFANNTASVTNNRIVGTSTTGVITISGNAFQSLNGLALVNANTGNNVAINASLNVNVAITPR